MYIKAMGHDWQFGTITIGLGIWGLSFRSILRDNLRHLTTTLGTHTTHTRVDHFMQSGGSLTIQSVNRLDAPCRTIPR
jgi:hypothetical protein